MAAHRQKRQSPLHGILVVDKPGLIPQALDAESSEHDARLPTSHDIVQMVRRWSGQRRIGHTGTLDPLASGVLVLCLGLATRLVEYYQGHDKSYYAEIGLGTATDTYDVTGKITETHTPQGTMDPLPLQAVEDALARFRGVIQQQPPAYSALKQDGETAYRRARRGEVVELPMRTVTFYSLELVGVPTAERIALHAHCSAGTYIRSLAHDLGQALGVPAHLALLRREAAGAFTLAHAHTLAEIEAAAQADCLENLLLAPGVNLDLPLFVIDESTARRLGFGQTVELDDAHRRLPDGVGAGSMTGEGHGKPVATAQGSLAQAYDLDGQFLGIIRQVVAQAGSVGVWKAEKWLVVDGD